MPLEQPTPHPLPLQAMPLPTHRATTDALGACQRAVGASRVRNMPTLQDVEGVTESALLDADAARLPPTSAPAPWATVLDAVVWFHRAAPGAAGRLPGRLQARKALPVTVGALVRYRETPVGPYHEVLAAPALLLGRRGPEAAVPFIAVDSLPSVHGGRENWALPKTL